MALNIDWKKNSIAPVKKHLKNVAYWGSPSFLSKAWEAHIYERVSSRQTDYLALEWLQLLRTHEIGR